MLYIFDDDKTQAIYPEFETYIDQMLDYFSVLVQNQHFTEVATGAKRQVLNLVRHSFFIKILMQDQSTQLKDKVCQTIIYRLSNKPFFAKIWPVIAQANPCASPDPTNEELITQISKNKSIFQFDSWQLPVIIQSSDKYKHWS